MTAYITLSFSCLPHVFTTGDSFPTGKSAAGLGFDFF
jgi:hypothetical protein